MVNIYACYWMVMVSRCFEFHAKDKELLLSMSIIYIGSSGRSANLDIPYSTSHNQISYHEHKNSLRLRRGLCPCACAGASCLTSETLVHPHICCVHCWAYVPNIPSFESIKITQVSRAGHATIFNLKIPTYRTPISFYT